MLNATLVHREPVGEHCAVLRVRPDERPVPVFRPGQFVQLGLPQAARLRPGEEPSATPPRIRIAKRSYSIASSALERDHFEFFLALVAGGRLTPDLWAIEPGGRCWIDAHPLGAFTLERVPPASDLLMIATGTGLSPYLSMLRTHVDDPPWRRFVLVHGVRRVADLGYRDELEARERADARFRYVPLVSREPWPGLRGRVQSVLEDPRRLDLAGLRLEPGSLHVFLCGNPEMIQSVRALLAPLGFAADTVAVPGNVHFERYW